MSGARPATGDAAPAVVHEPVLAQEVLAQLADVPQGPIVDCTLGLGGHARFLLEARASSIIIGLDLDAANLELAATRLAGFSDRTRLVHASFADLSSVLRRLNVASVAGVLADLGVSSNQLADPTRGLSFEVDGPLDMRLDRTAGPTAADLVNGLSEGELSNLLYFQSQERHSRRIARRICQIRRQGRIQSTVQLARLVASATGQSPDSHRGRIHPATRTFLALRMAVNRELESLQQLLQQVPACLMPGGRVVVISFHSGEDRIVKEDFRRQAREGVYRILTPKPVTPCGRELAANPRSRSAKLRVAERTGGA